MEPRIQYARAKDGVNIAFYALGQGAPLVLMPIIPWSHIQFQWQNSPGERAIAEAAAERFTYVKYDCRGSGSSTRDVTDFSLDAHLMDLEAVVERLGLERFALVGSFDTGPVAITYAARNPQRVSHLILQNSFARAAGALAAPEARAFRALREEDWTIYTETLAQIQTGWSGERARAWAAYFRESTTQEASLAAHDAAAMFDVTDLLPNLTAPTLVVKADVPWPSVEFSRSLAAEIPDARLVITDTEANSAVAIGEFLEEGREEQATTERTPRGGFATILFTDMESSTSLRRQLGDAKAQELVRAHNAIVREALSAHGGDEIKHTGDGIMASFGTASSGLSCAIAIQRGVAAHVEAHPEVPLAVYIGVNAGEPIAEEDDLFGTSIDLARRICDHAQPGQILASNVVRELAEGKGFLFSDIGEVVPKGFESPVRLYEVRWRE